MDHATSSPAVRAAVSRFPLLGRPRPACPALTDRVADVVEIADAAAQQASNGMAEAAHAMNKAALIASDCGLSDLARRWCWQHINVYRRYNALTILQAGYLLEPVLNLARLQIRAHNGQPALDLLQAMHHAVTTGSSLLVDRHVLPLTNLVGTRDELRQLRQWTWLQLLGEGIRILTLADRWDDAVAHAVTLNGIGLHLMEGRQAAIIAHILHNDTKSARVLLDASAATQPWERQVRSCLSAMCAAPETVNELVSATVEQLHAHQPIAGYAVYRTRLGLTAATLISAYDEPAARAVLHHVVAELLQTPDGYAAREALGHRTRLQIRQPDQEALARVVTAAGLGAGTMPEPLLETLSEAMRVAQKALVRSIR